MEWFVKAFLKASLTWLGLGVTLGVTMAAHPAWTVYRPAHMHMNVLGFVTMMIYGVAYHVIPRFTGYALHSRRLAGWQFWLANAGLVLMVAGFALTAHGTLAGAGAYTFIDNLWRTIDGPAELRRARARAAASASGPRATRMPVVGGSADG